MQGKASKTAPVSQNTIKYGAEMAASNIQLIEVDEAFLEEIFSNECQT